MVTYPSDWTANTLQAICIPAGLVRGPFGGSLKKSMFVKRGYKVYEQRNAIYKSDSIGDYYISDSKYSELSRFAVFEDDFIVSCSGTIGRIYKIPYGAPKGVINQALLKITIDKTICDLDYFYIYFQWKKFQLKITDDTQGGAMKNLVGMDVFRETLVFMPEDIVEQQAISSALSDFDEHIDNLTELIEKKKAIRDGALEDLVSGSTRLDGFDGEWEEKELNDFIKITRGASPRPIESYLTNSTSGVNWIKIGDAPRYGKYITNTAEKITQGGANRSVIVESGDFILSNSMSFGRPYILKVNGCIHDGWLRLYEFQDDADRDFLFYLLSSQNVQSQYADAAAGSGVQNLNKEVVKSVRVVLPSVPEQQAIAQVLTAMDEEIESLEEEKTKMMQIREGAMDDLLTGRVRLKVQGGQKDVG